METEWGKSKENEIMNKDIVDYLVQNDLKACGLHIFVSKQT